MFTKIAHVTPFSFMNCHDGKGELICHSLINGDTAQFGLFHVDDMPAGVSIGFHRHENNEELYYLQSGKGILTFDEQTMEMNPGDMSICTIGHGHAFEATEDSVLVVVGCLEKEK